MPTVTHELDTQNFEEFEEKEPASATAGTRRRLRADPNFIGYTYKNWEAISPREGGFEFHDCCRITCLPLSQCIIGGACALTRTSLLHS